MDLSPRAARLSPRQMLALQVSERTMSVMSILGSIFIITTFARWKYFRKPINRLVFWASIGNLLTSVATLISTSALPKRPHHISGLCELQGILIQWFMMADSLWVFDMALNVMLVFFFGYNSYQLRSLEKVYLLTSYGLPGIPAMIYVILNHHGPQKIIGGATLWCWVSSEVEWMRIAFFYAPVWIAISATLGIYIVTGHRIFKKRAELRYVSKYMASEHEAANALINPFTAGDIRNIKVETELKVETHRQLDQDSDTASPVCRNDSRSSFSSTKHLSQSIQPLAPVAFTEPRHSRSNLGAASPHVIAGRDGKRASNGYRATAFSTHHAKPTEVDLPRSRSGTHRQTHAAWGYFKVAFLMFAALFIVWVPSTVNRLQQLIVKDKTSFGLNLASALVLPLQGFWNSMIYIATTWPEVKRAGREIADSVLRRNPAHRPHSYGRDSDYTLAANETEEFEGGIPLGDAKEHSQTHKHSRLSSSDTMRPKVSDSEA